MDSYRVTPFDTTKVNTFSPSNWHRPNVPFRSNLAFQRLSVTDIFVQHKECQDLLDIIYSDPEKAPDFINATDPLICPGMCRNKLASPCRFPFPVTPFPVTLFPVTPFPVTPFPVTPFPVTSFPVTPPFPVSVTPFPLTPFPIAPFRFPVDKSSGGREGEKLRFFVKARLAVPRIHDDKADSSDVWSRWSTGTSPSSLVRSPNWLVRVVFHTSLKIEKQNDKSEACHVT